VIDPRQEVIARRLAEVQRIVAVTGGKGGIGKTLVSATLAACLAAGGRRAGLLDLDFTGPCGHLVLGAEPAFPEEDFGILPVTVEGVSFMSVTCFSGEDPTPLRGDDVSSALIELLAITRWGELDCLLIDLPPGLGDTTLEAARLLPRAEYLVVTTPSRLALDTVRRTVGLLRRLERPVLGLVENMAPPGAAPDSSPAAALAAESGLPFLGQLPRDPSVEAHLGQPAALLDTAFGRALAGMARQHGLSVPPHRS